ncbi:hypothetical protein SUGI_1086620 [Cryptomeria japonica]|uniref:17.8 kDa class I heat shock protein-like n=1 Tax=Cryptomeria japonica TaxID=3369 RepID=UPI002414876E|nr:17.8 kDa class I heat shock protein-like [Cryptomeria japonica]GLJ51034.1 hypothetical protein SUGI_1086620 [Cryptomeria japonica]
MDPFKLQVWDPLDLTPNMLDLILPIYIPVDCLETNQAHVFKANLPGLQKEDVKVQLERGVMSISGEFKKDEVGMDDKWCRLERPHGPFSRSFRIPENIMLDQVETNMTNGVLTLTIMKVAENKHSENILDAIKAKFQQFQSMS